MSAHALFNIATALRRRIRDATGLGIDKIHLGAPSGAGGGDFPVSLTMLDVRPNLALRNVPHVVAASSTRPVSSPATPVEAIALDVHFLIACYRGKVTGGGSTADPDELTALGRIIAALHADPVLYTATDPGSEASPAEREAALRGQEVRVSLETWGIDELNRLWALFPEAALRASVVYLATPVILEAGDALVYPRVRTRRIKDGVLAEPDADDRDAA